MNAISGIIYSLLSFRFFLLLHNYYISQTSFFFKIRHSLTSRSLTHSRCLYFSQTYVPNLSRHFIFLTLFHSCWLFIVLASLILLLVLQHFMVSVIVCHVFIYSFPPSVSPLWNFIAHYIIQREVFLKEIYRTFKLNAFIMFRN
jgi:hypothetical protein